MRCIVLHGSTMEIVRDIQGRSARFRDAAYFPVLSPSGEGQRSVTLWTSPAIVSAEVLKMLERSAQAPSYTALADGGTPAHEAGTPKRASNQVPIG